VTVLLVERKLGYVDCEKHSITHFHR